MMPRPAWAQRIYIRAVYYSRYHLQISLALLMLFTTLLLFRFNHFLESGAMARAQKGPLSRPPTSRAKGLAAEAIEGLESLEDDSEEVAEGAKSERQKSLTVVILTCNRPQSLQRLLNSLAGASYDGRTRVNLLLRQDVPENNTPCKETKNIIWRIRWAHGSVEHVTETEHQGHMNMWLRSFRPAHPKDYFLILEDDMEVSSFYARWLLYALDHFSSDSSVMAVTIAKPLERGKNPLQLGALHNSIPFGAQVVKYRLHTLRGLAPMPERWNSFLDFIERTRAKNPAFNPTEVGEDRDVGVFRLYRELDRIGRSDLAWDAWLLRFMIDTGTFVVYPWLEGGEALGRSWREAGALQRRSKGPDSDLLSIWKRSFFFIPTKGIVTLDLSGRPFRYSPAWNRE